MKYRPAHIGKTDISVSVIIPADTYRPICNIGNLLVLPVCIRLCIATYKARISADSIGRYIGYDKSISAYRLSVKFHRYANPGCHIGYISPTYIPITIIGLSQAIDQPIIRHGPGDYLFVLDVPLYRLPPALDHDNIYRFCKYCPYWSIYRHWYYQYANPDKEVLIRGPFKTKCHGNNTQNQINTYFEEYPWAQ